MTHSVTHVNIHLNTNFFHITNVHARQHKGHIHERIYVETRYIYDACTNHICFIYVHMDVYIYVNIYEAYI